MSAPGEKAIEAAAKVLYEQTPKEMQMTPGRPWGTFTPWERLGDREFARTSQIRKARKALAAAYAAERSGAPSSSGGLCSDEGKGD